MVQASYLCPIVNPYQKAMNISKENKRLFALDLLRVLACFLVVWQHVTECYYINPDMTAQTHDGMPIIGWMNSMTPIEVPLFVMISGYFLLPLKMDVTSFFKRRFTRILIPFVVWCVIYAVYYMVSRGDTLMDFVRNVVHIPVNFGVEIGHMWFIYMLLGLYMLVPVLSPWLEQCTKRQLQGYLGVWAFTTCLPYVHLWFPEVLGECFWNPTPMLYYFTGFAGYFVLGFYLRKFGAPGRWTSLLLLAIGYALTALIFNSRIETAPDTPSLELSWQQCSGNVALMVLGVFGFIHSFRWKGEGKFAHWVTDLSLKGYGMYLAHMIILMEVSKLFVGQFGTVLIEIPLMSAIIFLLTYLLVKILSYLPKSNYWLG